MYLSSGWHFGAHHIFFFSQAHPDRKHLNSERTSAVIPHSSILSFSRRQNPVILQYISLWLRKACRMKKKAKKWVSSNLCHALVPLSALRPVCTREQQKPPLENDVWKQAKFLGQLNSAQVKKSLCWKQFTSSLWGLAAAQRKVQGDCSISLYILHLASSKSSGEKKKSHLHQVLAATHICLERYAHSLSLLISAWGKSSFSGWRELVLHLGNKPV